MPVAYCSGREVCDRLISISAVPGGNPSANARPDAYASEWGVCAACGASTCDRCLAHQRGRCVCGAAMRLFTEAERIRVAKGFEGRPSGVGAPPAPSRAAPPAARHAPVVPRVVAAGGSYAPVGPMLEGVEQQIEAEIARGNHEKARALCGLAATILATQGQNAPADELTWLVGYGENFYRWRHFYEGQQYWSALHQLMKRHRRDASDEGGVVLASALAFQVLAGDLPASPDDAATLLAYVTKTFGAGHALAREVQGRLGRPSAPPSPPPLPAHAAGGPPKAKPRQRASTIVLSNPTLLAPPVAPSVANYDEPTRLALWVTLAFLGVAYADGRVVDQEYRAWQTAMAGMGLPDVWSRFGQPNLLRMLNDGLLYELSTEFAWLSSDDRNRMATALVEFMLADGRAEPAELQAVKQIASWIDVKLDFR